MEDYSNMSDLRQLITGAAASRPPPPHRNLPLPLEMMLMGGRHVTARLPLPAPTDHPSLNTTAPAGAAASTSFSGGLEEDVGGGTARWPRQETLTLLDIRSRLDPNFKEANHKGPLWDEVSRIMSEEHGYQRSGKKCREKFENLYKYYKKTKEGKAGRQDGKHYRFFRQLEALYGDTTTSSSLNQVGDVVWRANDDEKVCDSLSLSKSSEVETSSEEDNNGESAEKRRKRGRGWKAKIKEFIDTQMRKVMEKQEAWVEKTMRAMEQRERERVAREDQWRAQESARVDTERKLWAKERAWMESRDAALMEILDKIKPPDDNDTMNVPKSDRQYLSGSDFNNWSEPEMTRLIQLRSSLEWSHNMNEEVLWEEISGKMSCYGYERSGSMCKDKWDAINYYIINKTKEECNKKRKNNSNFYNHHATNSSYNQGRRGFYSEIIASDTVRLQPNNDGSSPSSSNVVQDGCFRFLMGDNNGDHHGFWESYGLKLNNGQNHN